MVGLVKLPRSTRGDNVNRTLARVWVDNKWWFLRGWSEMINKNRFCDNLSADIYLVCWPTESFTDVDMASENILNVCQSIVICVSPGDNAYIEGVSSTGWLLSSFWLWRSFGQIGIPSNLYCYSCSFLSLTDKDKMLMVIDFIDLLISFRHCSQCFICIISLILTTQVETTIIILADENTDIQMLSNLSCHTVSR